MDLSGLCLRISVIAKPELIRDCSRSPSPCEFGKTGEESLLPREAVVSQPWRRSRPGWMGPWAAELLGGSPAQGRGMELDDL